MYKYSETAVTTALPRTDYYTMFKHDTGVREFQIIHLFQMGPGEKNLHKR